ncbi:uncharacterized protein LOC143902851 [Temnothorax americanus]|uniref:uncharacterized protein LOC143902851 n=1 Tax=Temnothorax americanus TaxID=1964332 RepID=UPI004067B7C7
MVNCYICWKEFDSSFPRRFHSFPKDAERREKWFASIGYTISAYKNARICSDHFAQKDYYYCGTPVPCKRLYKTAIPSIFMQRSRQNKENSSNITNTQDNQDSIMDIKHDTTNGDNNTTNGENTSNITNTQDSQDLIMGIEHDTNNGDNNTSNGAILSKKNSSGKRKRCNIDEVEKVFVKTGKHNIECLKKTEFTSNAWITFIKYLRYNRYLNKMSVARKSKLEKKLISLQSMTQMLKAKNLVTEDVANALKVSN